MEESKRTILSNREKNKIRIITNYLAKKLPRKRAAEQLEMSERSISRLAARVELLGIEGVFHRNKSKIPINRYPDEIRMSVLKIYKEKFYDMNMTQAFEVLIEDYQFYMSYPTFRRWCHQINQVKRKHKRRRMPQRDLRTRMSEEGMLLQMDGSHHWFVPNEEWCLITAIDDATSEIIHGEFFEEETTEGCMKIMRKIIEEKGVPRALYVDKAGWSGGGKRNYFSQFQRACEEVDIEVIYANSPQAKGRIERAFGTIQDRLVPLFRIHKIKNKTAATDFFNNVFLPIWKQKFTVPARRTNSQYRLLPSRVDITEIFCVKHKRKLGLDRTFSFKGCRYYVDTKSLFENIHIKEVEIQLYEEDDWAVFYNGIVLPVYIAEVGLDGSYSKLKHILSKKQEKSYEIFF
ncbi:MAG TPA: ISNCY family transposase [Pseudobdellovibrionaceae bacterium]|nr:ISNCY family transposase [Pseudobdellovibrionaceae bacterium]